jgi:hypothetical protein
MELSSGVPCQRRESVDVSSRDLMTDGEAKFESLLLLNYWLALLAYGGGGSSTKTARKMEVRLAFLALSVAFAIAVIGAAITTTRSVESSPTARDHVILVRPILRS